METRSKIFQGPTKKKMIATYTNISGDNGFIEELARIIVHICQIVPAGVLCFVSSYGVLDRVSDMLSDPNFEEYYMLHDKKVIKALTILL
jgi:Rad3-related DNA helicase